MSGSHALLPKISLLIVTYRRLAYLKQSLAMLDRYPNLEVMIMNNDPSDDISELYDRFPDLELNIIEHSPNDFLQARNTALAHVTGDYICLLDDDDILLPGHFQNGINALEQVDFVHNAAELLLFRLSDGKREVLSRSSFYFRQDSAFIRRYSYFIPSGAMYHRSLHDELGVFDPDVRNYWDWDFYLRVLVSKQVAYLASATTLYFIPEGEGSLSHESQFTKRKPYLDYFTKKHSLGQLPVENFLTMLDSEDCKAHKRTPDLVWDGCLTD